MLKKAIVTAAAAASAIGMSAAAAPQALAADNDGGPYSSNGNAAVQSLGNSATDGAMSPQLSLVQGTLNRLCLGLHEIPVGVLQIVNVQDIQALASRQHQQCVDNSTVDQRDGALSSLLRNPSILSSKTDSDGGPDGGNDMTP